MDYHHPQIAEIYDLANPLAEDAGFYLSLAGTCPSDVLDLGCGTGTLCCALAARGHRVTGVDPAAAMLNVARRKPGANQIEWVECPAQSYRSDRRFDLIVMTGHAFQILQSDADALAVLATMRTHLKARGKIAFETRNPRIDWIGEWSGRQRSILMRNGERINETSQIINVQGEFISFETSYSFCDQTLVTSSTLWFPSREHIADLIVRTGLIVRSVFGDWDSGSFDPARSREIIFLVERETGESTRVRR